VGCPFLSLFRLLPRCSWPCHDGVYVFASGITHRSAPPFSLFTRLCDFPRARNPLVSPIGNWPRFSPAKRFPPPTYFPTTPLSALSCSDKPNTCPQWNPFFAQVHPVFSPTQTSSGLKGTPFLERGLEPPLFANKMSFLTEDRAPLTISLLVALTDSSRNSTISWDCYAFLCHHFLSPTTV